MLKLTPLLSVTLFVTIGCSEAPKMSGGVSKGKPKAGDKEVYDSGNDLDSKAKPGKDKDKDKDEAETDPKDDPVSSDPDDSEVIIKDPVPGGGSGSDPVKDPDGGMGSNPGGGMGSNPGGGMGSNPDSGMGNNPGGGNEGQQPIGSCTSVDLTKAKKPEDFACLGSVEAIFKNNPAWLKKHFTLFHATKSAQPATMENPRIIVSSPDGSFIFTTSTLPNAKKEVEIAVYDYENEAWQFAGIEWVDGKPKIEKELCKSCHGGDTPRTNWGSYGQWTGAYGQGGDHGLSSEQVTWVNKFKSKAQGTPEIMNHLDFSVIRPPRWAGPGEVETNEGIGYMMAFKAGRSLAAKVLKKGTKAQVRDVILETICANSNSSKTLTALGLPLSVHLQNVPDAGEGRNFRAINVGYHSNVWYFGLVMMAKAVEADPGLAAAAPEAVAFAKKSGMALMMTNGVAEYLAKKPNGGGIYQTNRNETQSGAAFNSSGAICSSIRNYNPQ